MSVKSLGDSVRASDQLSMPGVLPLVRLFPSALGVTRGIARFRLPSTDSGQERRTTGRCSASAPCQHPPGTAWLAGGGQEVPKGGSFRLSFGVERPQDLGRDERDTVGIDASSR